MKKFSTIIKIAAFIVCGILLEWDPLTRIIEGNGRFTTYVSVLCGLYFLIYMPVRIFLRYRRTK